jgi:hypothetical protein
MELASSQILGVKWRTLPRLRLSRQAEEPFVACRIALAYGREVLVFVAQKQT